MLAASGEATSAPMTTHWKRVMNNSDDTGFAPTLQAFYRLKVKKSTRNQQTGLDLIQSRAFLRLEFMEL